VTVLTAACGSDEAAEPATTVSPLVDQLLGVLRATTEPAALAEFDGAQPCLRETFAGYPDADLQSIIDGIGAQDLTTMSDELRQRFRDDALGCNEENRALDAADYKADAEQRIASSGVTSVQCEMPVDTAVGTTFACTGNFQNRTSEYEATIDAVGHVVIERTD
jgi:hypothetical protein